ncbi:hypothetical protein ABH931_003537 [Streptacidiphilus sp. MAP12-33]|uniref:hypothetical protein n=1 Tax=Streptacidiphilus sp. MAP12-33 TaxID=3156266 RepID=UPI0035154817
MSRGRHRQASRLGRALPSLASAVLAVAALAAALLTSSPGVLRILVAAVSVGAVAASVLLRQRESAVQAALVSEQAARGRDEARFEERVAELEYQAEVAEEQVKRLERRVLAQRSQLAHAEAAHAQLLRDRARVAAEQALRDADAVQALEAAKRGVRPTPTAYLKAANALRSLERQAEQAESGRTLSLRQPALPAVPAVRAAETAVERVVEAEPKKRQEDAAAGSFFAKPAKPAKQAEQAGAEPSTAATVAEPAEPAVDLDAPQAPAPSEKAVEAALPARTATRERGLVAPYMQPSAQPAAAAAPAWARAALPPLRPAAAVPPPALPRQGTARTTGAFNFFSRQEAAIGHQLGADTADVVGEEAVEAQARYVAAPEAPSVLPTHAHERTEHAIVDLTAEDETEPIDVRAVRAV